MMKIAIAGAGLLGRLLAFQLLESGYANITLYDRDDHTGKLNCAMAAAGMLAPYAELEKTDELVALVGKQSLLQWPLLLQRLQANIYFKHQGSLVTSHHQDREDLAHYLKKISTRSSTSPYQATIPHSLEPELDETNPWYYFKDEGQIDSQALMQAFKNYLTPKLCWLIQQPVLDVKPREIILNDKTHSYDWVFDCRGMGATSNFSGLRSVRGEIIWLHAPAVNLSRPIRLIHPRYSIYIVPRPKHLYLIGASEIEVEDYSAISVRTTLELLTAAYSLHKGFIDAKIIHTATHCRPTLQDHLPKIKYATGMLAINGLYRHGFLLAPQLVQDVLSYIQSGITKVKYSQWWEEYDD